jgi:hypothetical protein
MPTKSTGVCIPGINLNDPAKTERDLINAAIQLEQSKDSQDRNLGRAMKLLTPAFVALLGNKQLTPQDLVHSMVTTVGYFAGMVVATGTPPQYHGQCAGDTLNYFATAVKNVIQHSQGDYSNLSAPEHDDDDINTGPTLFNTGRKKPIVLH